MSDKSKKKLSIDLTPVQLKALRYALEIIVIPRYRISMEQRFIFRSIKILERKIQEL